jgi:hypothetical protein
MSSGGHNNKEAIRALQAAAAQIELALQQSRSPIDALGYCLRRLAAALADPAQLAQPDAVTALRADLLRGITCLQFHDRMTQHLQHVRDYLNGSAAQMSEQHVGDEAWRGLHNRLHDRLLSETQRMHLGRDFLEGVFARQQREQGGAAKPGDIDLF